MNCNDFILPIIGINLLLEDTDITYNVPANVINKSLVSLSTSNNTGYATLHPDANGVYGTPLVFNTDEEISISSDLSPKVGGNLQKTTIKFETKQTLFSSVQSCDNQLNALRNNKYSLLINFFNGQYGLVRCHNYGDGYKYSEETKDATTTHTIIIENLQGIQLVTSIN